MGGHSQSAPQAYMPSNQAGMDANYNQLVNNASPWAQGLPGQVIPGLNTAATNVGSNPYNAGAQAGANGVSQLAIGGVAPNMLNANNNLYGLGDLASQYAAFAGQGGQYADPMLAGATGAGTNALNFMNSLMPGALGGMSQAPSLLMSGATKGDKAWGETQAAIPGLTGGMDAANQLLANGFDPQNALYNRNFQQMSDQSNAINSMYGLGNSAYGANVAGDQARNFNIDWQNAQLGRQLQALSGYDAHTGQTTANLTNLLNTGGNQWANLTGAGVNDSQTLQNGAVNRATALTNSGVGNYLAGLQTGSNSYNSMAGGAVDRFGQMLNTAGNTYAMGAGQGVDALNTLGTATQLPANTYNQQQFAWIQALQALASGGGAALAPTNPLVQAAGNYLQLGQGATSLDQHAAQINNAQQAAQMQQLMQGLGMIAGIAMAPATGGLSLFSLAGAGGGGGGMASAAGAGALSGGMGGI